MNQELTQKGKGWWKNMAEKSKTYISSLIGNKRPLTAFPELNTEAPESNFFHKNKLAKTAFQNFQPFPPKNEKKPSEKLFLDLNGLNSNDSLDKTTFSNFLDVESPKKTCFRLEAIKSPDQLFDFGPKTKKSAESSNSGLKPTEKAPDIFDRDLSAELSSFSFESSTEERRKSKKREKEKTEIKTGGGGEKGEKGKSESVLRENSEKLETDNDLALNEKPDIEKQLMDSVKELFGSIPMFITTFSNDDITKSLMKNDADAILSRAIDPSLSVVSPGDICYEKISNDDNIPDESKKIIENVVDENKLLKHELNLLKNSIYHKQIEDENFCPTAKTPYTAKQNLNSDQVKKILDSIDISSPSDSSASSDGIFDELDARTKRRQQRQKQKEEKSKKSKKSKKALLKAKKIGKTGKDTKKAQKMKEKTEKLGKSKKQKKELSDSESTSEKTSDFSVDEEDLSNASPPKTKNRSETQKTEAKADSINFSEKSDLKPDFSEKPDLFPPKNGPKSDGKALLFSFESKTTPNEPLNFDLFGPSPPKPENDLFGPKNAEKTGKTKQTQEKSENFEPKPAVGALNFAVEKREPKQAESEPKTALFGQNPQTSAEAKPNSAENSLFGQNGQNSAKPAEIGSLFGKPAENINASLLFASPMRGDAEEGEPEAPQSLFSAFGDKQTSTASLFGAKTNGENGDLFTKTAKNDGFFAKTAKKDDFFAKTTKKDDFFGKSAEKSDFFGKTAKNDGFFAKTEKNDGFFGKTAKKSDFFAKPSNFAQNEISTVGKALSSANLFGSAPAVSQTTFFGGFDNKASESGKRATDDLFGDDKMSDGNGDDGNDNGKRTRGGEFGAGGFFGQNQPNNDFFGGNKQKSDFFGQNQPNNDFFGGNKQKSDFFGQNQPNNDFFGGTGSQSQNSGSAPAPFAPNVEIDGEKMRQSVMARGGRSVRGGRLYQRARRRFTNPPNR